MEFYHGVVAMLSVARQHHLLEAIELGVRMLATGCNDDDARMRADLVLMLIKARLNCDENETLALCIGNNLRIFDAVVT